MATRASTRSWERPGGRTRADYAGKIESTLVVALRAFYMGALGTRARVGPAADWSKEAHDLVHGALAEAVDIPVRDFTSRVTVAAHTKRAMGAHMAFKHAVHRVQTEDARYRAQAEHELRREFGMANTFHVEDTDTQLFWTMAHGAINGAMRSRQRGKP